MRLIDADALREEILRYMPTGGSRGVFLSFVDDAPTIEAVPVHGEWIVTNTLDEFVEVNCSNCGHETTIDTFIDETTSNFCPNCGADMRKKV